MCGEALLGHLNKLLPLYNKLCSGDDVSLACVFNFVPFKVD